ncbi:hypothetical protein SNE40_003042 [Patella caerulea]|uniref:Uncharacterized protein n=1 Tax=Patella caerulea TaxID=87958 RepID=A0AAN8KH63_PATCE
MCNTTNMTLPFNKPLFNDVPTILDVSQPKTEKVVVPVRKKCRKKHRGKRDENRNTSRIGTLGDLTTVGWVTESNTVVEEETFMGCFEQTDQLRILFGIVFIIRDLMTLPLGIFFDKYGTTRTRLLTVLVFAVGTLMMTFTKPSIPWLIVPALSLTAVAGTSVLFTNLQVGNLFSKRRHTVVSMYVGAHQSGALVAFLMQLSHYIGVNVQTSFMFLTIGIVPLLVSTIAFLPKSRIPWPLPADYGKRRNQSLDETMLRKQRAWQRRMSEVGLPKCRRPHPDFSPHVVQSLYIWSVVWLSVQTLQSSVFETIYVDSFTYRSTGWLDFEKLYGCVQMLAFVFAPMAGAWMDKRRPRELGLSPGTQQMTNTLPVMFATSAIGVVQASVSMIPIDEALIFSLLLNVMHRVFLLTNLCSFLMHLHFPQQHFGKFFGLAMFVSAIINAFQFPIKNFLLHKYNASLYVNIFLLVMCVVTLGHPINVWNHCIKRLIRDPPREDRRTRDASNLRLALPPEFVLAMTEGNGEIAELVPGEILPIEITGNGDIPEVIIQSASDGSGKIS